MVEDGLILIVGLEQDLTTITLDFFLAIIERNSFFYQNDTVRHVTFTVASNLIHVHRQVDSNNTRLGLWLGLY